MPKLEILLRDTTTDVQIVSLPHGEVKRPLVVFRHQINANLKSLSDEPRSALMIDIVWEKLITPRGKSKKSAKTAKQVKKLKKQREKRKQTRIAAASSAHGQEAKAEVIPAAVTGSDESSSKSTPDVDDDVDGATATDNADADVDEDATTIETRRIPVPSTWTVMVFNLLIRASPPKNLPPSLTPFVANLEDMTQQDNWSSHRLITELNYLSQHFWYSVPETALVEYQVDCKMMNCANGSMTPCPVWRIPPRPPSCEASAGSGSDVTSPPSLSSIAASVSEIGVSHGGHFQYSNWRCILPAFMPVQWSLQVKAKSRSSAKKREDDDEKEEEEEDDGEEEAVELTRGVASETAPGGYHWQDMQAAMHMGHGLMMTMTGGRIAFTTMAWISATLNDSVYLPSIQSCVCDFDPCKQICASATQMVHCLGCYGERYCSVQCRSAAWKSEHSDECIKRPCPAAYVYNAGVRPHSPSPHFASRDTLDTRDTSSPAAATPVAVPLLAEGAPVFASSGMLSSSSSSSSSSSTLSSSSSTLSSSSSSSSSALAPRGESLAAVLSDDKALGDLQCDMERAVISDSAGVPLYKHFSCRTEETRFVGSVRPKSHC